MTSKASKEIEIAIHKKIIDHELVGFSSDISLSRCIQELSTFFKYIKENKTSITIQYHQIMQYIDKLSCEFDICELEIQSLLRDAENLQQEQHYCLELQKEVQDKILELRNQIKYYSDKIKYDNIIESKAQEIIKYDTIKDLEIRKGQYERRIEDYQNRISKVKQEIQEKYDIITQILSLLSK